MRVRHGLLLIAALAGAFDARAGRCRQASGTEVYRYRNDAALHRRWAVIVDCEHPGYPASMIPAADAAPAEATEIRKQERVSAASPPPVTAGMQVALWSRGLHGEMHLKGTALEGGRTGEKVRVRAGLGVTPLTGIVRGPASVELLPAAPRWSRP